MAKPQVGDGGDNLEKRFFAFAIPAHLVPGCALPLPLYQKITLCGRLTLHFSQWEESPYLRFFVWHSKLSFLRETESVTTEALSTCPVFG
ncbi:hypothetical protein V6N13_082395 [Hibiscus sabdariffa]